MKADSGKLDLEARRKFDEYARIGTRAVQKAREENRRLGLPNVFTIDDAIYYEMPNGDVVKKSEYDATQAAQESAG